MVLINIFFYLFKHWFMFLIVLSNLTNSKPISHEFNVFFNRNKNFLFCC